jgi:hypothetical protein
MPELPKRKVGLVSCSGEEMAEGTITRLATLKVLESLRPEATVTICLPLFLAGGEGDRAFARFMFAPFRVRSDNNYTRQRHSVKVYGPHPQPSERFVHQEDAWPEEERAWP